MPSRSPISRPEVIAEAAAWFAEFRAGDTTGSLRARFDEWLRSSPGHIQAYLEVAAGWSELPTADPEGLLNVRELIARARNSADDNIVPLAHRSPQAIRVRRHVRGPALAAAAVSAAVVLGAAGWLTWARGAQFSTGIGEQRTITLADGSTVILNALSRIRVRLSARRREVDLLQGQAFFHDVDDPRRPFIVRSGEATVRAIGTQFDVYSKSGGAVVTVVQGEVAVGDSSAAASAADSASRLPAQGTPPLVAGVRPVLVTAGQQVTVSARHVRAPREVNASAATAWVARRLVFDNTPLGEAARRFNLYSRRPLVIVDPTLRSAGISGVYSSADPDSLVGFLRAQPNIQVTETAADIRVTRRNAK